MSAYISVLQQLLIDTAIRGGSHLSSEVKTGLGLRALFGFFIGAALIFLMVASFFWLDSRYSTDIAALAMGVIALAFAGICWLVIERRRRRRHLEMEALRLEVEQKVLMAMQLAQEEFGDTVRENPKSALLIAGLAGLLISRRLY